MNSTTMSNFQRFCRVGKTVMLVLIVIAALATVASAVSAIYVAALPKDALTVSVTDNAEFRVNSSNLDSLWSILADGFSYSESSSPEKMLSGSSDKITPPENQTVNTKLSFFNRSYSSAKIYSDSDTKVIEAQSSPAEYSSSDLVSVLAFAALFGASAAVALYMLKRLFAELEKCDSPFCDEIVKKMKAFGFSLLPVALFASVGETLAKAFLTAGNGAVVSVQWGVLIAFAVTMCLVTVFRYGVILQRESDETL